MLKLILADNQAIFRAGIAKVLAVEDEMRIVAQAQTQGQMFMALDKFRAAVLVVAAGFHNDFAAIIQAANRAKTRVVVLADTGESAQRYMGAGANGVVYRNVTSAALVDCVRKVARGEIVVKARRHHQHRGTEFVQSHEHLLLRLGLRHNSHLIFHGKHFSDARPEDRLVIGQNQFEHVVNAPKKSAAKTIMSS